MSWNSDLIDLKYELARLFEEEDSIRTIVRDTGIPLGFVKFNGRAINSWSEILDEADRRNKVLDVIRAVLKAYPENPVLQNAERAFVAQVYTKTNTNITSSVSFVDQVDEQSRLYNEWEIERLKTLRRLSNREKFALLDALMACDSIKTRNGRITVLEMLSECMEDAEGQSTILKLRDEEIAGPNHHSSTDRMHIMSLIKTCLRHLALGKLIEIISGFEGKTSLPMQQVYAYLSRLVTQVCTGEQLEVLERILSETNVPDAQLLRLYQASVPPNWAPLEGDEHLALGHRILQHLAHAPCDTDGISPLFEFAERIALQKQDSRGKLRLWVEEAARFLGKEHTLEFLRKKLVDENLHPSLIQPYLLVKLDSDDFDPTQFKLQAWFLYDDLEELELDDESYPLESLSQAFEQLLRVMETCSGLWMAQKEPIVEIFLPVELLNYDINRWTISYGPNEAVPISLRYPLVIRSLDRIYCNDYEWKEEMHRLWLKKWRIFKGQAISIIPKYCNAEYCNSSLLRVKVSDEVCLTLTFIPPVARDFHDPHILSTIIKTGIPIALWPRQQASHCKENDFQEFFQSLLSENGLAVLPERMLTKRKSTLEDNLHPVHHVTILWDDPDLLPQDAVDTVYLKAPDKVRR